MNVMTVYMTFNYNVMCVCMCMHIMIILYYRSIKLSVFIMYIQCNNRVILRTLESMILSF